MLVVDRKNQEFAGIDKVNNRIRKTRQRERSQQRFVTASEFGVCRDEADGALECVDERTGDYAARVFPIKLGGLSKLGFSSWMKPTLQASRARIRASAASTETRVSGVDS